MADFSLHRISIKRGEAPEMFDKYPDEVIAWDDDTRQWVFGGGVSWSHNRPPTDGVVTIIGPARQEDTNA